MTRLGSATANEAPRFSGFSTEAIQFLADLAQNNDRAWFQPRKAEFERLLKEPMAAMIAALAEALEAHGVPMLADPQRSPFRIYRDTRFSKDKSPHYDQVRTGPEHRVQSPFSGAWHPCRCYRGRDHLGAVARAI